MSVRVKFTCVSKIEELNDGSVQLSAVIADSPENAEFFQWTPSGNIHLGTINKSALSQFEVGGQYYVDFTAA